MIFRLEDLSIFDLLLYIKFSVLAWLLKLSFIFVLPLELRISFITKYLILEELIS